MLDDQAVDPTTPWAEIAHDLGERPPGSLSPTQLERLADALFWLDRLDGSVAARQAAYRGWVDLADDDAAGMAAWRLFYDHWLVGETVVAGGWLGAARDHVGETTSISGGWLAIADADIAMAERRSDDAVALGEQAVAVAEQHDDDDLLAMALQALGRAEVLAGRRDAGLALLDRSMIVVIGDRLAPLFTGWVYCNVIATCFGLADLRRAGEWCRAALRWCDSLRHGELYPGLCRVYAADLAVLRGDWDEADRTAARARASLEAHDERYAGAAHYVTGEVARLRGDLDAAAEAYRRAHRLGHSAQPGMALVRLQHGDAVGAVAALRASDDAAAPAIDRIRLLSATVDAAVAADDPATVAWAAERITAVAASSDSALVAAVARSVEGRAAAARDDLPTAVRSLRAAVDAFRRLELPYEEACDRERLAAMCTRGDDPVGARAERETARALFEQLGASDDAARVAAAAAAEDAGRDGTGAGGDAPAAVDPLTEREAEVVRLVATGLTNRQVASRLVISHHTVARHLANVYAKLGVGSRAAATAWAYDHGLVGVGDRPGRRRDGHD